MSRLVKQPKINGERAHPNQQTQSLVTKTIRSRSPGLQFENTKNNKTSIALKMTAQGRIFGPGHFISLGSKFPIVTKKLNVRKVTISWNHSPKNPLLFGSTPSMNTGKIDNVLKKFNQMQKSRNQIFFEITKTYIIFNLWIKIKVCI